MATCTECKLVAATTTAFGPINLPPRRVYGSNHSRWGHVERSDVAGVAAESRDDYLGAAAGVAEII